MKGIRTLIHQRSEQLPVMWLPYLHAGSSLRTATSSFYWDRTGPWQITSNKGENLSLPSIGSGLAIGDAG
jgi:hypothetical protein